MNERIEKCGCKYSQCQCIDSKLPIIVDCNDGYALMKKHNLKDLDYCEYYFLFDNGTTKHVDIYECHGCFKHNDEWIVYGHETIDIFDKHGKELISQHTR